MGIDILIFRLLFLGNLLLFIIVLSIYFTFNAILGLIFFQQLTIEFLFSYIFGIFYGITVSTFILLISSLMRSVSSSVVISVLILFIGFNMSVGIIMIAFPYVEPIYILTYHSSLYTQIFDFPEVRYYDLSFLFLMRTWLTPTLISGISVQLIYIGFDLTLSYFIFNLREL